MNLDMNKTIENLNNAGIVTQLLQTKEEVVATIKEMINEYDTVAYGGSETLIETGVIDFLRKGKYHLLDRDREGISLEEKTEIMNKSFCADVYLTSSNAITKDGTLYNVDGRSSRVGSIAYGPKKVILVVGKNKLVKSLEDAVHRVRTIAAPKNCVRLGLQTHCAIKGYCTALDKENPVMTDGCKGPQRICCTYSVISRPLIKNRIYVLLVNEDLGY